MALFTLETPKGIDWYIQKVQTKLYSYLASIWGVDDNTYNSYGRVYPNMSVDGVIPEAYVGNSEYKEVYFDDRIAVLSFFDIDNKMDKSRLTANIEAVVNVYFLLRLDKIDKFKSSSERMDEKCRLDVIRLLEELSINITDIKMTVQECIKPKYNAFRTSQIKFEDMHPYHCFCISGNVSYNPILLNC